MFTYGFTTEDVIQEKRTTQKAIYAIRAWLPTANLPSLSDQVIILFLLSCDNDVKTAKNIIEAHYRIKNQTPEMFNERNIDNEDMKRTLNTLHSSSIPARTDQNEVVHFFKLNDSYYGHFDLLQILKLGFMLLDVSMSGSPPSGFIVVADAHGMGFMHLTRLRLGIMKSFFDFLQEGLPMKLKSIHVLNTNYIFLKAFSLVRMFMKTEVINLMKLHPPGMDMETFKKDHIPAKCLPKDYGGDLPAIEELNRNMIEQLREMKAFFDAEEQLRKLNLES